MHCKESNDLVERRVRAPGEESVELVAEVEQEPRAPRTWSTHLDQQEQVGILALGGGTVTLLDVVLFDIDTLCIERTLRQSWGASSSTASAPSCSCRNLRFGVVWLHRLASGGGKRWLITVHDHQIRLDACRGL